MTERKELNAVVLFSGGFDSVALYHHVKGLDTYDNIFCLYVNYGNGNMEAEMECIKYWVEEYGVQVEILELFNQFGKSTIQGGESTGDEEKDEYVPMRNLQFLALATAFAEVNSVRDIYFGFVENFNFPYPDTSPLFLQKANDLVSSITGGMINVKAPFIDMGKADVANYLAGIYGKDFVYEIFRNTITCNTPKGTEPCMECEGCLHYEKVKLYFVNHL